MNMKLTPNFMLSVLSLAALIPMSFGVSIEALVASVVVVLASTFLLDKQPSGRRFMSAQAGEVGEPLANVEKEYKDVKANLKQVGDDLKAYAETSQKEIAKFQGMTTETKASVDDLLTKQGELNARLQAAEQALVDGNTGGDRGQPQSMGGMVIESDEFKANADKLLRAKGSFSVNVQAAITSDPGSAGDLIDPQRVPGIITPGERRFTVRDLVAPGRTTSNSIEYARETGFTNSADVVSENPAAGKPESSVVYDLLSAPVATIAHFIHASRQVLSDATMLQSNIDGRLRYGLKLKEELQLLKGSGVGLNINGLHTQASAYANPGVAVADDTVIDRLRIAMLQVQLAEYAPDGIVLNPIDWTGIELTKDTQGRYVFANPQALAGPVLWGLPVVATQSMDAGEFMTGAFRMGAQIWDREDVSVAVSTEDRDNFIKNMVTILCEERVGLTVYRPEAFVKGDFTIGGSGA